MYGGVSRNATTLLPRFMSVYDITIFYKDGTNETLASWNEPTTFNGIMYVSPVSIDRYLAGKGNIQRMIPIDGIRDVTYTREPIQCNA